MWKIGNVFGKHHEWWQQSLDDSCGAASIVTVINLIDRKKVPEMAIRLWLDLDEDKELRKFRDLGPNAYDRNRSPPSAFPRDGTKVGIIEGVLNSRYQHFRAKQSRTITKVSPAAPGIVRVQPPNGNGHFTVCLGEVERGSRVFLDPSFGVVVNSTELWPSYDHTSGSTGAVRRSGEATHLIRTRPWAGP